MKSFEDNLTSRFLRVEKALLTRPVRRMLLRVPFLPRGVARALDDIRFVEPDVLRFITNTVRPGWRCADIGAHCGTVALRLARLVGAQGFVAAVEPIEENAALLRRNIEEHGFADRCVVLRSAVGAVSAQAVMTKGDHSTTWHFSRAETPDAHEVGVEVSPLDILLRKSAPLDFIKVDIEGAETELVQGAAHFIQQVRPLWLFEMHGTDSWSLARNFLTASYSLFDLQGRAIRDTDLSRHGYGHAVFCPDEKLNLLG
jgi:FkbM family methyltransferase